MIRVSVVKKYGAKIGLDFIGVASAEPFTEYVEVAKKRIESGFVPLESQNAEDIFKRLEFYSDPENSVPNAKSILSLGMRYLVDGKVDDTRPGVPCGRIGRHYWRDFYGELWRRQDSLNFWKEKESDVQKRLICPTN